MSKYKIIIILGCAILISATISGIFFEQKISGNKINKTVLTKPNNLENKNI